ncbi:ABC transporter substrate-binding protein [Paenibacillus hodogayensis]|uniref:ABC transporter substrate-binding protein n=1 Tax=Paenibacillus hodogayensis TaxID=279208 RepID=A0ABV5W3Y4_9BACL
MIRRKRTFAFISLIVVMVLGGCSSGSKTEGGKEAVSGSGEMGKPYELTIAYPGENQKDLSLVQDAINQIALRKINATVKLLPISFSAWAQQKNLMIAGNEKLDLIVTLGSEYTTDTVKGSLLPLNDLIDKHGSDIKNAVGKAYLKGAEINGKLYAVPSVRDFAAGSGVLMRKDLVAKYNIDVSSIRTLDDVGKVLDMIKQKEPGITPLANLTGATPVFFLARGAVDGLGDLFGALPGYDNGLKVVDWYESDQYAGYLDTMRNWYTAGYLSRDVATSNVNAYDLFRSKQAFAYFASMKPGIERQESLAAGVELVAARLGGAYTSTSNITVAQFGIARNTKNADKAMQFLNLMYADADIVNLFDWGVAGKHYTVKPDGLIAYPDGVSAATVGYNNSSFSFLFGNQTLSHIWEGNDPALWDKLKNFNNEATKSKALGFSFDTSPVKTEIAALMNVTSQYATSLETGSVDTKKVLPQFIEKLKIAGIDKVIAEKQKQLNAWAAAKP